MFLAARHGVGTSKTAAAVTLHDDEINAQVAAVFFARWSGGGHPDKKRAVRLATGVALSSFLPSWRWRMYKFANDCPRI